MDTAAARKRFDVVAYLKLFRFPLVFTAIADSAAGYLLSEPTRFDIAAMALLAVGSVGLYFFGMALNDIADREKDRRLAPNRMIPSGRLSSRAAGWAAILSLTFSLAAIVTLGFGGFLIQRVVLWGMVVACICTYNLFLKIPPVMGLVRAFNLLMGVSVLVPMGWHTSIPLWVFAILGLPAFLYVSALTYVSTLEDSALDRTQLAVGVAFMALGALFSAITFPVWSAVDGWSGATGGPELSGYVRQAMRNWQGFAFASLLTGWIVRRAWMARDQKGIMLLVRDGVGGIILLDASLVASVSGLIPALCIAALVIPAAISVAIFKRLA